MNNYRVENVQTYQPQSLGEIQVSDNLGRTNPSNINSSFVAPTANSRPTQTNPRNLWGRTIDFIASIPRQIGRAGLGISPPRFDGAPPPFGCGARTGLEDYSAGYLRDAGSLIDSSDSGLFLDASIDSISSDAVNNDASCDPYARFTRLIEPRNSEERLVLAGLGGLSGEFICYSRYNERAQTSRSYIFNRLTREEHLLEVGVNPVNNCSLSDDGRFIVFSSRVTNTEEQVILLDMRNPFSPLRTVLSESHALSRATPISFPKITPDGTMVFFTSDSTTITSDNNSNGGIFSYHILSRNFSRLALPSRFLFAGGSSSISVSNDGNRIAFITAEPTSTPNTFAFEAYLWDRRRNSLTPLSQNLPLVSRYATEMDSIFISGDGRKVFFNRGTATSSGESTNVYFWEEGGSSQQLTHNNLAGISIVRSINRGGTRFFMGTNITGGITNGNGGLEIIEMGTNRRAVISQNFCRADSPFRNSGSQMSVNGEYGVAILFDSFTFSGPIFGFGLNTFLNP